MKNYLKTKFTSRKFLAAFAGVLTGIILIITGDSIEGAAAVIASVTAYLAAEGYIDAKAVQHISEEISDKLQEDTDDGT